MADEDGKGGALDPLKNKAALAVAIIALVAYVIALIFLFGKADDVDNDRAWERWVFLFTGLEAIVFAGIGWLFGREVNRGAAEQAEKATEKASQKTAEAERAKSKTDAIVAALEESAGGPGGGAPSDRLGERGVAPAGGDAGLARAAAIARGIRDAG